MKINYPVQMYDLTVLTCTTSQLLFNDKHMKFPQRVQKPAMVIGEFHSMLAPVNMAC
jgi:hypothetical protein